MAKQINLIRFHYPAGRLSLSNRTKLKEFLSEIFRSQGCSYASVNFIFCSSQDLLTLNQQYLKHDYHTDILTFVLSKKDDPVEADIYISPEMINYNSGVFNSSFRSELHRVIFHGVLHLCGLKDKTKTEKAKMRYFEDKYLNKYFKIVPRKTVSG